eukprot:SAG31_NODE_268_length_18767_cov_4.644900_1_plen_411_part_00
MYGVGGDPEARYPRKLQHTGSSPGVGERWGGGRFDYLDRDCRTALTEWTRFDEVDELLKGSKQGPPLRWGSRVEVEFIRNRMEQLSAPSAEKTQEGNEILEYFNMDGRAFACLVCEDIPAEPGMILLVRHYYVEALDSEAAAALSHEQSMQRQRVEQTARAEQENRQRAEAEAAYMAQIDAEEREREERLAAEAVAREEAGRLRAQQELLAPVDLGPMKQRVRSIVKARYGEGLKGIQRFFSAIDSTRSGKWSFEDLVDGLKDFGVPATRKELRAFFDYLDVMHVQRVSFESFFVFMKGQLPERRRQVVQQAFAKLDRDHDGLITADDMRTCFDGSMHPGVMSGKRQERQIIDDIVADFESRARAIRSAASPESSFQYNISDFEDYYGAVGAYIDDEDYFTLMVKRSWQL